MKRRGRWILAGAGLAIAAAIAFLAYANREYVQELPLGCAFKAKALCAGLFLQGLPKERIEAEDSGFDPAFSLIRAKVDERERSVTCSILGTGLFAKKAVYVEGLGPVLLSGVPEGRLRELAASAPPRRLPAPRDPALPWPEGEAAGTPRGLARPEALAAAVDGLFAEPGPSGPRRTRAVVVVVGGRIVAERYADGISGDTRLLSWSMAKSFTNALVGIAVGRGKLDLRAAAPVPEWSRPGTPGGPSLRTCSSG